MSSSDWRFLTAQVPAAIAIAQLRGPLVADFLVRHVVFHSPTTLDALRVGIPRRANLVERDGGPIDDTLVLIESLGPDWVIQMHLHGGVGIAARLRELLDEFGFDECRNSEGLWNAKTRVEEEILVLLPSVTTRGGLHWMLRLREQLPAALRAALAADSLEDGRRQIADLLQNADVANFLMTPSRVAICGPPNAGKSTLINALTDKAVSLVADRPGTTRDWIEAPGEAGDFPVMWIDTAGMRETAHELEASGIERAMRIAGGSRFVVVVLDASMTNPASAREFSQAFAQLNPDVLVWNKCDIRRPSPDLQQVFPPAWSAPQVFVSARDLVGIDELKHVIARRIHAAPLVTVGPAPVTPRQIAELAASVREPTLQGFRSAVSACLGPVSESG